MIMVEAYNFLFSWQLIPEKSVFPEGEYQKSGQLKIEASQGTQKLRIETSWVDYAGQPFNSVLELVADGELHAYSNLQIADFAAVTFQGSHEMLIRFLRDDEMVSRIVFLILPNGTLRVSQYFFPDEKPAQVAEYQKQLSVLPYASRVSSVAISPTQQGHIRHTALQAMEEQTNMQLGQIREQIELLARQARTLQRRHDLSLTIYEANLNFQPVIGQTYFLYEKKDGQHTLSLISPKEWGGSMPYKRLIAAVRLLADHTWQEIENADNS